MNKRPGHVEVTTEVNYCSFCDRVRNLRREEHHLGTLVRTVITCETCHRTLSSTMGVAPAETPATEAQPATVEAEAEPKSQPAKRATPTKAKAASPKAKAASPKPKAAKSPSAKSK